MPGAGRQGKAGMFLFICAIDDAKTKNLPQNPKSCYLVVVG